MHIPTWARSLATVLLIYLSSCTYPASDNLGADALSHNDQTTWPSYPDHSRHRGKFHHTPRHPSTMIGDQGPSLTVMTLNAEHLMSASVFERWQSFCAPLGWRDTPADHRPRGLPYCDALNGQDLQGRFIFGPQHTRQALQSKFQQLAQLIHTNRPDLLLMQEVTDAEAVRSVLGPDWIIHTTAEHWSGEPISQHLAIAWPKYRFLAPPQVEIIGGLAHRIPGEGRITRPGLAVYLRLSTLPDSQSLLASRSTKILHRQTSLADNQIHPPSSSQTLAILNVHLKAGCRYGRLDLELSHQPHRKWRRKIACHLLQSQIPALQTWLNRQIASGHAVLISGDFNRDVQDEIRRVSTVPLPPASRTTKTQAVPETIAGILPTLQQNLPSGVRLTLIPSGHYGKRAPCHHHIDPFLLGGNLSPWLRTSPEDLLVQVIPFMESLSLDKPRPSDHCPHLLRLPLRIMPRDAG